MRAQWTGLAVILAIAAASVAEPAGESAIEDAARRSARVELGRRLFFDPKVSRGGRVSCGSCHDPSHGFTDPVHPSADEWGAARRRTMPLADLGAGPFHADGEFATIRDLLDARLAPVVVLRALLADVDVRAKLAGDDASFPKSYGSSKGDPPALVRVQDRLTEGRLYATAFTDAFGDETPTHERVCQALEDYVRTLRTSTNALDRFLMEGATLPSPAARGLALFTGKAGCAQCHDPRPADDRAPLRDGRFHDTGVSFRSAAARGAGDALQRADLGFAEHMSDAAERRHGLMKFKTPSLRDVARRGPFMHDGSLATLRDVVDFYDGGNAPHQGQDRLLHKLGLSAVEKDDLVAFLGSLSGDERPGVVDAPARPRTLRVRLVDPAGRPLRGVAIDAEGVGDRFRGAAEAILPLRLVTDGDGRAAGEFPPTTHVRLHADGLGVAGFVPDCAGEAELVAVPTTHVALRIRTAAKMPPARVRATPLAKADARGRPIAPPDGDRMEFVLARRLSDVEALYLAPAPPDAPASSRRDLVPTGSAGGALPATVDVDLRGGATTGVDLTPLAHAAAPTAK
jgi:cytochrome c peroxidase